MVAGVKMASDEEKIAALKAIRDKARASRLETGEDGTFAVYDEEEDENLRRAYPEANIVAVYYDPGASEVNQLNRIKLMLSTARKNLNARPADPQPAAVV